MMMSWWTYGRAPCPRRCTPRSAGIRSFSPSKSMYRARSASAWVRRSNAGTSARCTDLRRAVDESTNPQPRPPRSSIRPGDVGARARQHLPGVARTAISAGSSWGMPHWRRAAGTSACHRSRSTTTHLRHGPVRDHPPLQGSPGAGHRARGTPGRGTRPREVGCAAVRGADPGDDLADGGRDPGAGGDVALKAPDMRRRLRELADQVIGPVDGEYRRPWMCAGDPVNARVFIVGINPATSFPVSTISRDEYLDALVADRRLACATSTSSSGAECRHRHVGIAIMISWVCWPSTALLPSLRRMCGHSRRGT